MRLFGLVAVLGWVGCSAAPAAEDGGVDAGPYVPTESRKLGLNDVTFLLPLDSVDAGTPMPGPEAMVSFELFDRLTTTPGDVLTDLNRLRVVALRFDVCDRAQPGPCPPGADGSLRLVLQPLQRDARAEDVALHAFFPVPPAELPQVVDELRGLARLQDLPLSAPLQVNAAWRAQPEYRAKLAALVGRYAKAPRLVRLTLFGQLTMNAALIWVFRGVEKQGAGFVRVDIPDVDESDQQALLFGAASFTATPVADAPRGFARVLSESAFRAATPADQRLALESLTAADNPTLHTAQTVQCVTCHVATTLLTQRAADAGVALSSLATRYTAPFDLTPLGKDSLRPFTLRALGWLGDEPLVAQRTVHETANVVEEVEARFPPAP
ncbi:MAG: hypothetical protein IT380_08745 [Myxococcales bacterium]|nr:hypothetical protein [Myxococcales bacterium]